MKRTLRIVAIIVGILIVVLLVVPFLIPVNQFRPTIEETASEALGRKVQVGNLSLSLFSGSLSAENLSIADDPKFSKSTFLTAQSVKVGVELIPLIFSKTLNVTGVTIESPEVTLLHNPSGEWNFSSLGTPAARTEEKSAAKSARAPTNATSSKASTQISVKKLELTDGRIIVGTTTSSKRSSYDHVTISASDVSMTSKFPVTITADLPAGGKFKLDGTAGPIDQEDASLTPLNAKLNIDSLNLASTGFLDSSAGLGGLLDLDATIASQNGEAETKGTAKLSKAQLVAGGSPSSVPVTTDFSTKYNLRTESGTLNSSTVKVGNAAAHLSGTYNTSGEQTTVNVKLDAQNAPASDLQAFLPALGINLPRGASLQGGNLGANLNITGPINKLVIAGNVGLFSAKLAGFDLGSKMSAIASLAGIHTGKDLDIEKFTSNLRMAPDGLKADNILAVVPSLGTLIGGGTIDAKNNLDFKMAATLTQAASSTASASGGSSTAASSAGLAGLIGKFTGAAGGSKGGLNVPFLIQGTASDPKFIPDVGGIAAGFLKSQLGGLTSPSANQQQQPQQNQNPLGALGGLFKKKKP